MVVRPEIASLPEYRPGVQPEELLQQLGITGVTNVIRLHNNEEPWEPFPDAIEAITRAAHELNRYPDQSYGELTRALAAHYAIDERLVQVGNGSSGLIRLVAQMVLSPGDEVLLGWPGFPSYLLTCGVSGGVVRQVPLRNGAADPHEILARVTARTRLVFLANPNNPTGSIIPRTELEWYFDHVPETLLTVLDEAYFEFISEPDYPDGRAFLQRGRPLIALRTMSKAYGLAGLRIGFGFATPELSEAMSRARDVFTVSSLAMAAAVASLRRQDLVQERARRIVASRRQLEAAIEALGLEHTPSEANFVFMNVRRNAQEVFVALLRRGVMVRAGGMHDADTWIRVTIGADDENAAFLAALEEALAEVPETR